MLHCQEPYAHIDTFQVASGVVAGTMRLKIEAARMPPRAAADKVFSNIMVIVLMQRVVLFALPVLLFFWFR
jgi:hypothetical protein